MTQVRDRGGVVTDVSPERAKELTATGFYQYVSTPVKSSDSYIKDLNLKWGVGVSNPRGGKSGVENTYAARGQILPDTGEALSRDAEAAGLNNILEWQQVVLARFAQVGYNEKLRQEGGLVEAGIQGPPESAEALRDDPRFAHLPGSIFFTDPAGGSGSGSGRGAGAPAYVAPDRRTVEEFIGDKMIVLTGKRQPELQKFVDNFMRDAKKQWEGGSIDPQATALEDIRGTAEYKRIHTLRVDSMDENTWVNARQARLTQLGLGAAAAEARGIELAVTGTNLNDIDIGKFQIGRGRKDITLMNRLEKVAEQIAGQL